MNKNITKEEAEKVLTETKEALLKVQELKGEEREQKLLDISEKLNDVFIEIPPIFSTKDKNDSICPQVRYLHSVYMIVRYHLEANILNNEDAKSIPEIIDTIDKGIKGELMITWKGWGIENQEDNKPGIKYR